MAFGIFKSAIDYHDYFMDTYGDPRVKDWFLMGGPFPTIALSLGYFYVVKHLGPRIMKNRKPYDLKNTMIVYNAALAIISLLGFILTCKVGWLNGYSLRCQPCDFSSNPDAVKMAKLVYMYYLSKFVEFIDTIIFVLRKKDNQISTLHLVHHSIMPIASWVGAKFYPGGHVTFLGTCNALVHFLMYTYYLLSAMGPEVRKYLWWKKYLTTIQLAQFVIVFLHSFQLFFIDCPVPMVFAWIIVGLAVVFFVLFSNFYNQAYSSKSKLGTRQTLEKLVACMPTPDQEELKEQ